ncbi:MAG: type II secretion system protein GspG [Planctomycetaceae bacterium]|nr:type II secretion system protein GspG [Planctomycetaceae bacterium]
MPSKATQQTVRTLTRLWIVAGLVIYSSITVRSVVQNNRVTTEALASVRQNEGFQQLSRLSSELSGFVLDRRRLPADLAELVRDRSSRLGTADLTDPWGTAIRYEILAPQPLWFRLSSAGADRTFGTEDDLVRQVDGTR